MPLPAGALAVRVSAGQVSLPSQDLADRRKLLGQTLPALAQGQFGNSAEPFTCFHLSASALQNRPLGEDANLATCEFPSTWLNQMGIEPLCEVPAGDKLRSDVE